MEPFNRNAIGGDPFQNIAGKQVILEQVKIGEHAVKAEVHGSYPLGIEVTVIGYPNSQDVMDESIVGARVLIPWTSISDIRVHKK